MRQKRRAPEHYVSAYDRDFHRSNGIRGLGRIGRRDAHVKQESDFFRFRGHLDGAVIAFLTGETVTMKLCLNPYSEHWQALRGSPFACKFPTGLVDPVAEETLGQALIADTDIDRKDKNAVLSFLQDKYKVERLMNMDMNMATAVVVVPRER